MAVPAVLAVVLTTSSGPGPTSEPERRTDAVGSTGAATLYPPGSRYMGDPIPVVGYISHVHGGAYELVLEEFSASSQRWSARATELVHNGGYRFPSQRTSRPGPVQFRTVLYADGRVRVATSNVVTVDVVPLPSRTPACERAPSPKTCSQPAALVEQETVDTPHCPRLLVTTNVETRTINWRWDAAHGQWVRKPTPWTATPGTTQPRTAGVGDCVKLVGQLPERAALPDLQIKDLTRCGKGDREATGGSCFVIIPSAPYDGHFPALTSKKLLKFPVITANVGDGPAELIAERAEVDSENWTAYQSFYDANGDLVGSLLTPALRFYFAGDGHDHWHVRDFDDYELLDESGTRVARAEKHGYCMQDNTTYRPRREVPGMPSKPVYPQSMACGGTLPHTITIVHGLSVGWGDTYPTSLPDQALDITGVPDGVYTVRVHADADDAVKESDEHNNTATVKVRLAGDKVTVLRGTSAGGIR